MEGNLGHVRVYDDGDNSDDGNEDESEEGSDGGYETG